MKIAMVGAGKVGGTLGARWAEKGHTVLFGMRDTSKEVKGSSTQPAAASKLSPENAAGQSDVLVTELGYEAIDAGNLIMAQGRDFAYRIVRR